MAGKIISATVTHTHTHKRARAGERCRDWNERTRGSVTLRESNKTLTKAMASLKSYASMLFVDREPGKRSGGLSNGACVFALQRMSDNQIVYKSTKHGRPHPSRHKHQTLAQPLYADRDDNVSG